MKNSYANTPRSLHPLIFSVLLPSTPSTTVLGLQSLYSRPKEMRGCRASYSRRAPAFTIVELLIVIVVIGILATISIVAYNGIQQSARKAKINADLTQLEKAIIVARNNTGKTLYQITGNGMTASPCAGLDSGTDIAGLDDAHNCKANYRQALTRISDASGINVKSLFDPYGRPYWIDENEGASGSCDLDRLGTFSYPLQKGTSPDKVVYPRLVSLSGNSGCAI